MDSPTSSDRRQRLPAIHRGPLAISAVLILIVALLMALVYAALYVNDGLRAYTIGNRHWSTARMQATTELADYIRSGDRAHLDAFHSRLEIPLADRRARIALESGEFDYDTVFRDFAIGDNHPADIARLINLYRWFGWHPRFRHAIVIWQRADEHILALRDLATEIETTVAARTLMEVERQEYLTALADVDDTLIPLEQEFAESLGETARWVNTASMSVLGGSAVILLAGGLVAVRRLTARTFEAEERLRTMVEQAPIGIIHADLTGRWLQVNQTLCRILGYPREHLLGACEEDFLDDPDTSDTTVKRRMRDLVGDEAKPAAIVRRYRRADGETVWLSTSTSAVYNSAGKPTSIVIIVQDVTESHRLSRELSYRARHDPLTGLINRDEFQRRLENAIERVRVDGIPAALCYLDLDQFKVVNDTCGHGAGDAVLIQVGTLIRSCLRTNDTLARFGGDEFVILFEACTADKAQAIAERILSTISSTRFTAGEDQTFSLGASVGLVPVVDQHTTAAELLSAADAACYSAKESGRNQVHFADPASVERHSHHQEMHWAQRLYKALEEDRFFLVWQPVVRLADIDRDAPPRRFEVLVRMRDDDGEIIMPGSFIAAAERFGQIVELDHWVVDRAIAWLEWNPRHADDIDLLSINLSGLSISDASFLESTRKRLQQARIVPAQICFEITETMMVTNMTRALRFMQEMHELGCRFALDDFGIGVSSFAYLHAMPVEYVKIDGIFVRDIDSDPIHDSIVRCIHDVAHATGQETVAESVESPTLLPRLRSIGCDYVQGYAIGEPVEIGSLERRISPSTRGRQD